MGVVEVMVRLKSVLHHANKPPTFLQISCHIRTLECWFRSQNITGIGYPRWGQRPSPVRFERRSVKGGGGEEALYRWKTPIKSPCRKPPFHAVFQYARVVRRIPSKITRKNKFWWMSGRWGTTAFTTTPRASVMFPFPAAFSLSLSVRFCRAMSDSWMWSNHSLESDLFNQLNRFTKLVGLKQSRCKANWFNDHALYSGSKWLCFYEQYHV